MKTKVDPLIKNMCTLFFKYDIIILNNAGNTSKKVRNKKVESPIKKVCTMGFKRSIIYINDAGESPAKYPTEVFYERTAKD